jgi:hypothetical protein
MGTSKTSSQMPFASYARLYAPVDKGKRTFSSKEHAWNFLKDDFLDQRIATEAKHDVRCISHSWSRPSKLLFLLQYDESYLTLFAHIRCLGSQASSHMPLKFQHGFQRRTEDTIGVTAARIEHQHVKVRRFYAFYNSLPAFSSHIRLFQRYSFFRCCLSQQEARAQGYHHIRQDHLKSLHNTNGNVVVGGEAITAPEYVSYYLLAVVLGLFLYFFLHFAVNLSHPTEGQKG